MSTKHTPGTNPPTEAEWRVCDRIVYAIACCALGAVLGGLAYKVADGLLAMGAL